MKKIVCLTAVFALLCMAGCRPGQTVRDAQASVEPFPVWSPTPEPAVPAASPGTVSPEDMTLYDIYDAYGDPEALLKFAHTIDASSRYETPVQREFTALIKNVRINESGDTITVSLDRIEPAENVADPATEPMYANEAERVEDIDIRDYDLLILVDPYNHFQAVTAEGLPAILEYYDDTCDFPYDIPFHFYSVDGEIKILMEMMLP